MQLSKMFSTPTAQPGGAVVDVCSDEPGAERRGKGARTTEGRMRKRPRQRSGAVGVGATARGSVGVADGGAWRGAAGDELARGLSSCAKTRQNDNRQENTKVDRGFPTVEECRDAAGKLSSRTWEGEEGKVATIQISPSLLRLGAYDFNLRERREERARERDRKMQDQQKVLVKIERERTRHKERVAEVEARLTELEGVLDVSTDTAVRADAIREHTVLLREWRSLGVVPAEEKLDAALRALRHARELSEGILPTLKGMATENLEKAGDQQERDKWEVYLEQLAMCQKKEEDRRILEWSQKSRTRMISTFSELDWNAFLEQPGKVAMATLTYPGDWQAVAPDSKTVYAHLNRLRLQFQRDWGREMLSVWKREFQRRGAPHYHLLMVVPEGTCTVKNPVTSEKVQVDFTGWLAATWARIVAADQSSGERARHLVAGTGLHYTRQSFASPRHASFYFSKYAAKNASGAEKEYQNRAPAQWIESGASVGRFWGVFGLKKVMAVALVTADEMIFFGRTLARWAYANFGTRRRMLGKWRAGWVLMDDAPGMAKALFRALNAYRTGGEKLPVGMRGSVALRHAPF
ncbi:hypothetical protein HMPREF2787_08765 [Corynebacterium sp. HMSC061H03]|nr:hypothetical protein HMPREF2787_08765 [Corynebacterium sp. HMSC061H03]